jgi:hypothetical protein
MTSDRFCIGRIERWLRNADTGLRYPGRAELPAGCKGVVLMWKEGMIILAAWHKA